VSAADVVGPWHDGRVRFHELAEISGQVASVSGRKAKIDLLATALRGLAPDERSAGAAYLAGELRQRQIGVGYASLRDLPEPAAEPSLTVAEVDATLEAIGAESGPGSQARRRAAVHALFAAATPPEQRVLVGLIGGELRQGAQAGLLAEAVARAAEVDPTAVRRALLLSGDLKEVAVAALGGGADALAGFGLRVGRGLSPMLAQPAATLDDALAAVGLPAMVDAKLDGVRIQVHRDGDAVRVFTRSLDDVSARMGDVVSLVGALPAHRVVLDGEVVLLDAAGLPRPFQETSSRAATSATAPAAATSATAPAAAGGGAAGGGAGAGRLTPYFFDLLHLDGRDLIDEPAQTRWRLLAEALPADLVVPRTLVSTVDEGREAYRAALAAGHEGVVVKDVDARYDVGRRGGAWTKVKPRHTLDLVVLAAEWGHGRRRGWLSNLHLGARDPDGGFVMLGKTFKGLTDELLRWQTQRLLELATERGEWVVRVRPELVVEIAFDGVQASPRYPGGVALRFARVLRYREDKTAAEADTIATVRAIHGGAIGPAVE
jgi:DNA ligase-1